MLEGGRHRWAVAVLVAAGVWLAPAVSNAQNENKGGGPPLKPFATLKLYEVQEGTDLRGRDDSPALRVANAALVGSATGAICAATAMPPAPAQEPCAFDTVAESRVPLHKGYGPIDGTFQLLWDAMPDQHLLSDLVMVADGRVQGTLDLRPLLFHNEPFATMEGKWKSRQLDARGTFTGTFFVPFPDPTGTCPTGFAYGDRPGGAGLVCLAPTEFSLGNPVTKVVATFLKTGRSNDRDKADDDWEIRD
jgi:hypothetical protein